MPEKNPTTGPQRPSRIDQEAGVVKPTPTPAEDIQKEKHLDDPKRTYVNKEKDDELEKVMNSDK